MRLSIAALALLLASPASAQTPGWADLDLGGSGHAVRYLPSSVRPCDPLPTMLFLHGAGGTPEAYESFLQPDAEALGVYIVAPQASGMGWSGADTPTLNAALTAAAAEVNVDGTRTYFAGHSAGGAFAYLVTYGGSTGVAAVFTLSAPYYMVGSLSDPSYTAPIHMYYGADDPNYTMGGASALEMQWTSLGVPHETDVQTGYGHSTWPPSSMHAGFVFLLAHHYPGTPPATRCGGADAGMVVEDAGTVERDAGTTPRDAGAPRDAGVPRGADAAPPPADAGANPMRPLATGCGCRAGAGSSRAGLSIALIALAAIAACRRRR